MANLEFEPFSSNRLTQLWQARRAYKFVRDNPWVRPDTAKRYSDYPHSVHSIARMALRPDLMTGFLWVDRVPSGLGSIVMRELTIETSDGKTLRADRQIDYQLKPGTPLAVHRIFAENLITYGDYRGPVMATMSRRELEYAAGIPAVMAKVGDPECITVIGDDPDRLMEEGPLQVFYGIVRPDTHPEA